MNTFTGWQYLLIDLANAFGLDKKKFEDRIQWAENNLANLESLVDQAETKPLYVKAMLAVRKAQQGTASGHLVGFDAVCSGMQIMSAVTGCESGAMATGLIDTGDRPDAYTTVTEGMNSILGGLGITVPRSDAKDATMKTLYGSKAEPIKIFGEGTDALKAFYESLATVAPGAWALLDILLNSWQSYTLAHHWQLPDGFNVKARVMDTIETRIEVDELGGSSFTYQYKENVGLPKGHHKTKSNAANVVHSIDAYVLRSVHRRCNYDLAMVTRASAVLDAELLERKLIHTPEPLVAGSKVAYYVNLWAQTGMVDAVILPYLTQETVQTLPDALLDGLIKLVDSILKHKPFDVITIHDEFKCHPNNMNQLRWHYKEILAELAESTILDFILSTIHGRQGSVAKLSNNLGQKIRQSNYALC